MILKKQIQLLQNIYKRLIFKIAFLILFLTIFNKAVFAQEVTQSINTKYQINQNGMASISYDILLTNQTSNTTTQSYSLNLAQANPQNLEIFDQNTPLTPELTNENGIYTIKIVFNNPTVGKGTNRRISINYTDNTLAEKYGNVWEITLPVLIGDYFGGVVQTLSVPNNFGELAYISPEPIEIQKYEDGVNYIFNQGNKPQAISAAFGEFQVYSFGITYHLENPVKKDTLMEIAIPPDTSRQKIFYENLEPKPENITIDEDGNWIAQYKLKERESKEIKASGAVQIFSFPRKHKNPNKNYLNRLVESNKYWQSDDPVIKNLAIQLKTPKNIYDYVVSTLSYNYDRVRPEVKRMGAQNALNSPLEAMCLEFTDLFIAIARAAGIPTREVNGYAYTENPKLQPLSLVADVLHAWPEYWDDQAQMWVPVDPTWGNTSGLDYFKKLDLNHFTFVTHGLNSETPYPPGSYKLGAHPQKDVYVSFSRLPEIKTSEIQMSLEKGNGLGLTGINYKVSLYNPGPVALYNQSLDIEINGSRSEYQKIDVLPPFMTKTITIKTPVGILGSNAPKEVKVFFADKQASIKMNTSNVILGTITVIFLIILTITAYLYWKYKKK